MEKRKNKMNSEQKFWCCIIVTFAIIIMFITGIVGGCCIHRNSLVTKMIKNGVDPLEARIAVRMNNGYEAETLAIIKRLESN